MYSLKKVVFFLIFFSNLATSYGQSVVLNINTADCSSCYKNITLLDDTRIGLPIFVVFKKVDREDSIDLDNRFSYSKMNMEMLFNDSIYKLTKLKGNVTSVNYFNTEGKLSWSKNLSDLSAKIVQDSIISMPNLDALDDVFRKYVKDKEYVFNNKVGNFKVYNKQHKLIFKIASREVDFELLKSKLPKNVKPLLDSAMDINKNSKVFTPSFTWYEVDKNGNIYLLYKYAKYRDNKFDALGYGFCIYKISEDLKQTDIYPINFPADRIIYENMFMLDKDNNILILLTTREGMDKMEKSVNNKFVSKFKFSGTDFNFDKYYALDLPYIYEKKYFENFLSINYSVYPFVAFYYDNQIYNIEKGIKKSIIEDNTYKENIDIANTNITNEIFSLKNVGVVNNKFIVIYRLKNDYFINAYDENLNLLSHKSINCKFSTTEITRFEIIAEKRQLQLSNEDGVQVVPIDFYL